MRLSTFCGLHRDSEQLPFIICWPRRTNLRFCFCLQQTNRTLPFLFSLCSKQMKLPFCVSSIFHIYWNDSIYIYIYMLLFPYIYAENGTIYIRVCFRFKCKMKNGSPIDSLLFVYYLLIMQTEVCHLPVYWQRNKWKLSICKWTKRTKHTCPSMHSLYYRNCVIEMGCAWNRWMDQS